MPPTPIQLTQCYIDRRLSDHYQRLLDRPVPARFDRLLAQLRANQKVLEVED